MFKVLALYSKYFFIVIGGFMLLGLIAIIIEKLSKGRVSFTTLDQRVDKFISEMDCLPYELELPEDIEFLEALFDKLMKKNLEGYALRVAFAGEALGSKVLAVETAKLVGEMMKNDRRFREGAYGKMLEFEEKGYPGAAGLSKEYLKKYAVEFAEGFMEDGDYPLALSILEEAAEREDERAYLPMAKALIAIAKDADDLHAEKTWKAAYTCAKKAEKCKQGDPKVTAEALSNYKVWKARWYLDHVNEDEGIDLLIQAARLGHAGAAYTAVSYLKSETASIEDLHVLVEMVKIAVDGGCCDEKYADELTGDALNLIAQKEKMILRCRELWEKGYYPTMLQVEERGEWTGIAECILYVARVYAHEGDAYSANQYYQRAKKLAHRKPELLRSAAADVLKEVGDFIAREALKAQEEMEKEMENSLK